MIPHFRKTIATCVALALVLVGNNNEAKADVLFTVTGISIQGGNGIGDETVAQEAHGTKLGIDSTVAALPAPTFLSVPGDVYTFVAGYIQFNPNETSINATEASNTPLHDINFTVKITYTTPTTGPESLSLLGTAFTGPVFDSNVDYKLSFGLPVVVPFGTINTPNGTFEISIQTPTTLSNNGQSSALTVVTTLDSYQNPVPEPSSLALLGLGGIGLAFAGYRRRKTAV